MSCPITRGVMAAARVPKKRAGFGRQQMKGRTGMSSWRRGRGGEGRKNG